MPSKDTNLKFVKGVGPQKALLLAKRKLFTIGDLVEYFPRRYEDRSQLSTIQQLGDNQLQTFQATVDSVKESKPRRGLTLTKITVRDETGLAELVWFNQPYIKKWLKPGVEAVIAGKAERRYGRIQISHPEIEVLDGVDLVHTGRIVPIYPASESLGQRWLRTLIRQVLDIPGITTEYLPQSLLQRYQLVDRTTAMENIHFPKDDPALAAATRRLVFEELYLLQCGLLFLKNKHRYDRQGIRFQPDGELIRQLEAGLPVHLTGDQQAALADIKKDMEADTQMQRLIQGDVGSGKTILAALALAKAVENGYQGAMMVPTEILAEQHCHTLAQLLAPQGVKIVALTGKLTKSSKEVVLHRLREGLADVVIGTHALIQSAVEFKQLGLVITDEQHRFGVEQRALLQAKGQLPDVLVMTATPIPRTMALTIYGDLDVSVIRQLPPGRKPIKTYAVGSDMRERVYRFIGKEVASGRQAFVVCPLVEESEYLEVQSAVQLAEQLQATYFKELTCGLVHGKMKSQEKEEIMQRFHDGVIQVLVATTVIEVGVNVPNASVMLVEGADRFGLAQLHQLRGRIGRGEHQSYCILLTDSQSPDTKERLAIVAQTQDGFLLAEKDLELRGPGQFFGMKQHGIPDLKIADILQDTHILLEARQAALETVDQPEEYLQIRPALLARFGDYFGLILNN